VIITYLRFFLTKNDEDLGRKMGLFSAGRVLNDEDEY
jgi:hypothetical protein